MEPTRAKHGGDGERAFEGGAGVPGVASALWWPCGSPGAMGRCLSLSMSGFACVRRGQGD